eukprot:8684426-Alexandrium_andersonii.AAC.1
MADQRGGSGGAPQNAPRAGSRPEDVPGSRPRKAGRPDSVRGLPARAHAPARGVCPARHLRPASRGRSG